MNIFLYFSSFTVWKCQVVDTVHYTFFVWFRFRGYNAISKCIIFVFFLFVLINLNLNKRLLGTKFAKQLFRSKRWSKEMYIYKGKNVIKVNNDNLKVIININYC